MLKRHGLKKGLSLVLVFCLILSLMPTVALAQEPTASTGTETTEGVTGTEGGSTGTGDTTGTEGSSTETGDTTGAEGGSTGTGDTTGTEGGSTGTGDTTGTEGGSTETGDTTGAEGGSTEGGDTTGTGTGDTTGEDSSILDEIKDVIDNILKPIPGEKTPEEIAAEEAAKKAEEEAAAQAAAEEAARLEAERLAAEQARAEELASVLDVGDKKDPRDTSDDGFYKVVHLDAGRKYFTSDEIKTLIDNAAAAGYNQLELYLSDNEGFRFALDDMEITTGYDTYDLSDALSVGECLDQTEMSDLIDYAKEKGVEIVPCINTPGHMGAILDAFPEFRYSGSETSIDLTNPEAVAFALAIVEKYAAYFAGEGCDFFNIGADEYANDIGDMGFARLYGYAGENGYEDFVNYLNAAAQVVINEGMTPRAFNDGIYYHDDTSFEVNPAIQVCYWSNGWPGYYVASADTISEAGHQMINTHGDYYWVLGNSNAQCDVEKAKTFDYESFMGSTISNPEGAMFCIWCDSPNADSAESVIADTADVLKAFGSTLPQDTYEGTTVYPVNPDTNESDYSISVTAPGLTAATVKLVQEIQMGDEVERYMAYDIQPQTEEGAYTGPAQVTLRVPDGWNLDQLSGFVQEGDGSIKKIPGTYRDGSYTFEVEHFSTVGILQLKVREIIKKGSVTLYVGGTTTDTISGLASELEGVEVADPDVVAVTVENTPVKGEDGGTLNTLGEPVSGNTLTDGCYVIASGNNAINRGSSGVGNSMLSSTSAGTVINNLDNVWTVSNSGGKYTITNSNGNISLGLTESWGRYSLALTNDNAEWSYDGQHFYYTVNGWFGSTTYYYLRYNNGVWSVTDRRNNATSLTLYPVVSTPLPDGEDTYTATITFKGLSKGETTVTVGGVYQYEVTVKPEDLANVDPLELQYWITNGRGIGGDGNNYKAVSAEAAYSESGVDVTEFAPTTTTKESRTIQYWRCRLLDTAKWNNSTSGTEEQTEESGDDETYNGTGFTKIRYWDGQWSVYTEDGTWVNVESRHQLVAYYLEILPVADELTVTAADWGKKGDGSVSGDYLDADSVCTVSVQVIYEDSTTNPKSTTAADLNSRTIAYGFWDGGRGIGTLNLSGLAGYQIWKVEAQTGTMSGRETLNGQRQDYGSYTVSSFTWRNDAMTVYEGDPVDSYVIHNSARSPRSDGYYKNLMWAQNKQAILIKVYVKAPVTEDSLTVHYVDQTAGNEEFYSYNINVVKGTVFDEGFALQDGTLINNEVENIKGISQTVTANLSELTQIGAEYRYSEYKCVNAVRSDDGKDVYLYYTFNNTHSFVVDFGLPLTIKPEDIGVSGDWTSATVSKATYGDTAVTAGGVVTYTPTEVLTGMDTIRLTLKGTDKEGNPTEITHIIYLYPATTVYYEQGFADYSGTGWTGQPNYTGNGMTQAAEVAGEAKYPYGYDPAYNNASESVAESKNVDDTATFTFTGTGVDIYAKCAPNTGVVMVQVESDAGTVKKTLVVDTAMRAGGGANVTNAAHQEVTANSIPIVSLDSLPYANYTVTITHVKRSAKDTNVDPVYLDGFRVHGTMDDSADDVYAKDSEASPTIQELRDAVLKVQLKATSETSGVDSYKMQIKKAARGQIYTALILSGLSDVEYNAATTEQAQDLLDNGPKNELYLAPGESLLFKVGNVTGKNVQVGLKKLYGDSVTCTVNSKEHTVYSTDMFYKVEMEGDMVTITNDGTGILSVTELKVASGN